MQTQQHDESFLRAALAGYESMLQNIDSRIEDIKRTLEPAPAPRPKKRHFSKAARKRMADAQNRRWAAFHAKQGGAQ
jgi:hypothetical protein